MALLGHIYRSGMDDASNGGISSRTDRVIIDGVAPGGKLDDGVTPHVVIVERTCGDRTVFHAEPVDRRPESEGFYCAGGTLVYSGDSRFSAATGNRYAAIPLHDRFEEYR